MQPDKRNLQSSQWQRHSHSPCCHKPAVMETKPAKMPLHNAPTSYFFIMTYRSRKTVIPPVAAAKVVFIATWAAKAPSLPDFIVRVEPGLKPYHPNQRAKVPSTTNGKLWHSNSSGFVKRPFLGPRIVVPARPAAPPVRCTTPDRNTQVTGVREQDTLHFLRL